MEHENIIKAQQGADILRQDLRAILSTENALLADAAMELIHLVGQIDRKLSVMEQAMRKGDQ